MARIVADIEQLTELKATLDQQAGEVENVLSTISGQLSNTTWEGPSADALRSEWTDQFQPALNRLEEALDAASRELEQRIQAYQTNG